ncbi:hypothetical protein HDU91_002597, partial [Kappamyces sp. JEL0680]
ENATWRRFFQSRGNEGLGVGLCDPRVLDWSRDQDKYWFYAPFYGNESYVDDGYHSRLGSECDSQNPLPENELKPALKKKINPGDYISNIKIDCSLRKIHSDTALVDPRKASHQRPIVKDILLEQSPTTPKDIVFQFFAGEKSDSPPISKVRFQALVEERLIDDHTLMLPRALAPALPSSGLMNPQATCRAPGSTADSHPPLDVLPLECSQSFVDLPTAVALLPSPVLNSADRRDGPVCLRKSRQSRYLDYIDRDTEYQNDVEYLDYPDEEIGDEIKNQKPQYIFYEMDQGNSLLNSISSSIEITCLICASLTSFTTSWWMA